MSIVHTFINALRRSPPLEEAVWRRRHGRLRLFLAAQAVGVIAATLAGGGTSPQTLALCGLLAYCTLVSGWRPLPRRLQQCFVAFGLFTVSALVVRLAHGEIAAHFHYFVMLPCLALYEDGLPFAVGVAYVVVQHGVMGSVAPEMVFAARSDEVQAPWLWAAVHGVAVLAESVALRIVWRASRELRASERRSRRRAERYFERAATMLVDLDPEGRVRAANPAACAVLGRAAGELVGADWFETALPAETRERSRAGYAAVMRGTRSAAHFYDNELVRADGTTVIVSWQPEVLCGDDDDLIAGMLCSGTDVTARRRAERELENNRRDLARLRHLAQDVARAGDGRQAVTSHVQAMTDAAWVALFEPDGGGAALVASTTTPGCPLLDERIELGAERSVTELVFRSGEQRLVADVGADTVASPRLHALIADTRSIYYVPIQVQAETAGVLVVGWESAVSAVTERRASLVALAAHEAGIALERLQTLRRLERLAVTDPLTELPNRRLWDRELPIALARARRSGAPLAVALMDLNAFKALNDAHGHEAGDRVLRAAAVHWQRTLRSTDLLVRFGGDEFAALLPDCDPAHAEALVQRLKSCVPHTAGVSVGLATWDGAEAAADVLRRADEALYADKARAEAVHATGLLDAPLARRASTSPA